MHFDEQRKDSNSRFTSTGSGNRVVQPWNSSLTVNSSCVHVFQKSKEPQKTTILFIENHTRFSPVHDGQFHMYHFLEMIAIAFTTQPPNVRYLGSPNVSASAMCGPLGINCVVAKFLFPEVQILDYDNDSLVQTDRSSDMTIEVHRGGTCDRGPVNKPWYSYIEKFPTDSWYEAIHRGLQTYAENSPFPEKSDNKIRVGYIDRQNTKRRLLPEHHEWLVAFLSNDTRIDFLQLHMENFRPEYQIQVASTLDVLVGVHGNGLSHALWMHPRQFVIEFFWWDHIFAYDYATTAEIMKHSYTAIYNGKPIDPTIIRDRIPPIKIKKLLANQSAVSDPVEKLRAVENFEKYGKAAVRDVIEQALSSQLQRSHQD